MNELKRDVFYGMLDMAGRVFIVARYAENVIIGNRGFTEDEKKNGIVLVFNKSMSFSWDDSGITSTLVFGTSPQKCFVPSDDIVAIYSPELNAQFITALQTPAEPSEKKDKVGTEPGQEEKTESKVVKVDFRRKRTPKRTEPTHHGKGGRHEP